MKPPELPFITSLNDSFILSIYVQPRASKNQICGIQGNELKIRLTSPPVDGAANKLCREFVADLLNVSKSSVEIISGESSRHKRLKIACCYNGQLDRHIISS
jgi:uncharacterized protein (TIGR00251 family)